MLLCIDPGLNNCGLAVCEASDNLKVLETHNIKNARKFTDDEKTVEAFYSSRVVKVNAIIDTITAYLEKYPDIDTVPIEAPFYHASTPMAYSSLLEVVSAIKYRIVVPRGLKLLMLEPMLVKKLFIPVKMTKLMTGKEWMKKFLLERLETKEITYSGDVELLSEHEIDAIGVGFTYMHVTKESLLCGQ